MDFVFCMDVRRLPGIFVLVLTSFLQKGDCWKKIKQVS